MAQYPVLELVFDLMDFHPQEPGWETFSPSAASYNSYHPYPLAVLSGTESKQQSGITSERRHIFILVLECSLCKYTEVEWGKN